MNNKSKKNALINRPASERNNKLYDLWSIPHFLTGVLLGFIFPTFIAIGLMVIWEPIEILVLSPILAKYGIDFGFETLKNSLSDIVVDTLGVALGYFLAIYT